MKDKIFETLRENKVGHHKAHFFKNELLSPFRVSDTLPVMQPEKIEQWLKDNGNEHIRDKDGLTGQYSVSVKDIVDVFIDLS